MRDPAQWSTRSCLAHDDSHHQHYSSTVHRRRHLLSTLLLLLACNLPYHSHAFQSIHRQPRQVRPNNGHILLSELFLLPMPIRQSVNRGQRLFQSSNDDDEDDDTSNGENSAVNAEIVWPDEDEDQGDNEISDWLPDRVKARVQRLEHRRPVEKVGQEEHTASEAASNNPQGVEDSSQTKPTPYTEEEEDVIAAMGGKTHHKQRRREMGYLGDSTLREIATDYSVPVSYLADVLCMWGVLPPIQIDDVPLGDMVTGEQAFAILEAVNSLDVGALNDRYSNTSLRQLCFEYDIDLQDAFSMVMKEGWSLPFGVETCLRVEQEDELLRVLSHEGSRMTSPALEEDEEEYMYGDPY